MYITFCSQDTMELKETFFGSGVFSKYYLCKTTITSALEEYQQLRNQNPADGTLSILIADEHADFLTVTEVLEIILKENTIKTLELMDCNINDTRLLALQEILPYNTSLQSINLASNNLGDESLDLLLSILSSNNNITKCNIRLNQFSQESISKFYDYQENRNNPDFSLMFIPQNIPNDNAGIEIVGFAPLNLLYQSM